MPDRSALAALPQVDRLVGAAGDLVERYGRRPTADAARRVIDAARRAVLERGAEVPDIDELLVRVDDDLAARRPGPPQRVVNASGVVVHTNLGRAPLSATAVEAVAAAAGCCVLEYDLATGRRGSRGARLDPLLAEACGAEAGIAVNNAAAALVLVLTALAGGRQVPVARGELVEIGGSFRLPEIMGVSGARLLEVGTTNRTRAADYRAGDDVGLLLKVHPSNYRVTGFTQAPSVAELATVARDRGVPLVYDVGSGLLAERDDAWLVGEPAVGRALAEGADVVVCSGDKLLGGPQAGLLVGRRDLVDACRQHPLSRALRLDKLRIAALVVTLEAHLAGRADELPVWRMLDADPVVLRHRAQELASAVGGEVVEGVSLVGGGSAPGLELPSPLVRLEAADPSALSAELRDGDPPIVVRVADHALWIDVRTLAEAEDDLVAARVAAATSTLG